MLVPFKSLCGWTIQARDGELGSLEDLIFDDRSWSARYLVVDTGKWVSGRKVLVRGDAVRGLDRAEGRLEVALEIDELRRAPDIDSAPPVSRQRRIAYLDDYRAWLPWRRRPGVSPLATRGTEIREDDEEAQHARSAAEILGYGIHGGDRVAGVLEDLAVDDEEWAIPYLVVTTPGMLSGPTVLVPSDAASSIELAERQVRVRLRADVVGNCPECEVSDGIVRDPNGQRIPT